MDAFAALTTPAGPITVHAGQAGITRVTFGDEGSSGTSEVLRTALAELHEYFRGERQSFSVPSPRSPPRYSRRRCSGRWPKSPTSPR